ncbi:MAG TPA: amidohydrolase [Anaerolineales bacterium]|nr:amidohydrolase [Anaerolineales bacterium]
MPTLIIHNARIYTQTASQKWNAQPWAQAIAFRDGRVLAVGKNPEICALAQPHTELLDAHGRLVLPGLTDSHLHLHHLSQKLQTLNVELPTLSAILQAVADRAQQIPPGSWILGQGFHTDVTGIAPLASWLDAVAPYHPVYLLSKSVHSGWANSLALQQAHITAATPDPASGQIVRSPDGSPSGALLEMAMELLTQAIPRPTASEWESAFLHCQQTLWQLGLTGVHCFDGRDSFYTLQSLHQQGKLGLRVLKQLRAKYLPAALSFGVQSGLGDDWLRLGQVKVFADGALGPRTAAMLTPYAGEPDNLGMVVTDKEELTDIACRATQMGWAMTVHAIGDRANHDVLDALQTARTLEAQLGIAPTARRHRIEHVQILHPSDVPRLAHLQVIASMQPLHATSDYAMADRYWGDRSRYAYALASQLQAGAVLALGSDAPVESPNPWLGIHAAVTRTRTDGTPHADGWYPAERLSVAQAVQGYTVGAAYAAGMENRLGRLDPGFLGDCVLIDRDIFTCHPQQIWQTQVLATITGGQVRWRADSL